MIADPRGARISTSSSSGHKQRRLRLPKQVTVVQQLRNHRHGGAQHFSPYLTTVSVTGTPS